MKRSFHLCETIIANRGFYLFIERNDQLSGILVDIPCLRDFRSDSLPVYRQRVCVRYLRRIRLFIVLDDQGDFRAGGACAERLVPSKSEKKIPLGR